MTARIIEGQAVADEITREAAAAAQSLATGGKRPLLTAVQVGEHPASRIYTNVQARACEAAGIGYRLHEMPAESTCEQVVRVIRSLNADASVTGVILQMPLPAGMDPRVPRVEIVPAKDVEGVHPVNLGKLFCGGCEVAPSTAMAAVELLRRECPDLAGKEVVVIGHSEIVGKPTAMILLQSPDASPTVTVCHVATRDLAWHTRKADAIIVAAGVSQGRWLGYQRKKKAGQNLPLPNLSPLISADMVRPGAIVIDVAVNRIPKGFDEKGEPLTNGNGKPAMVTVGDVDFAAVRQVASAITPVPGGVGPVTMAMLLRNIVACAKSQA